MKKKVLNSIAVILTIGIIYEVYIYFNSSKDNKVLENIQIADSLKDSKQIAIKVQNDDFTWDDKGVNYSQWPSTTTHEYYGSECIDEDGSKITSTTDIINFDVNQNKATITTDRTVYCTLSFARKSGVLELLQKTTSSTYLKTVAPNDELLRYVGDYTNVTYTANENSPKAINNFICFGTNNIDTCTKTPATYMYRIIGITTENVNASLGLHKGQLKIIKAEPNSDGKSVAWNSNYSSDIPWDSADVQKTYLNTTFMKTITDIQEKVGTHSWSDLIGVNESPNNGPKWYIGDNTSASSTKVEVTSKTLSNHKIGLMYASDYYNAGTQNTNNWLNICRGRTGTSMSCSGYTEWTMTRYGCYSPYYYAWRVYTGGALNPDYVYYTVAVRPVFYLTSNITISGKGTEASPFIISDKIV